MTTTTKTKRGRKPKASSETQPQDNQTQDQQVSKTVDDCSPGLSVEVEQSLLATALVHVKQVVPTKPLQPIQAMILIEAHKDNAIQLTGTNLNTTIRATVSATVNQLGALAIPATLKDVVSRSATGTLQLQSTSSEAIALFDSDRGRTTLTGMDSDDFPRIQPTKLTPFTLKAEILLAALKACLIAACLKEEKGVLHGVHLVLSKDTLHVTATDGHRLAQATTEIKEVGTEIECTLHLEFVKELCRLLSETTDSHIQFSYDVETRLVGIQVPLGKDLTVELMGRCYEAPFPDVEALKQRYSFDKSATLNRLLLATRLERLEAVSSNKSPLVYLRFTQKTVTLSKLEDSVQAQQVMDTVVEGVEDGFAIGFNLYYLLSFTKAIDSNELQLSLSDTVSLVNLTTAGSPKLPMKVDYSLMPMQILKEHSGVG
ncbi:MAG: DNA polymerase III subunit beta [Desertifilum sp.]|nr:DNA polymerase III subunit beta [Desertifilum sp.]